ncbi:uncharacterized protein A4U43_C08F25820 [Asparagus officinalis]|nr:uncharacterized protein A4U43_C08F25820 [Asparagus officinalis]
MKDLVENLFPDSGKDSPPSSDQLSPLVEEILVCIPGAILHLIDKQNSVELTSCKFSVTRICQAENIVAILAHISGIQWPLAHDEAVIKLYGSHHDPSEASKSKENLLNYGLTFLLKDHGIQWPLAHDEAVIKLYGSHHDPSEASKSKENLLNYGLTFLLKDQ